jgi:hypothetical protein
MHRTFWKTGSKFIAILATSASISACALTEPGNNYATEAHLKKDSIPTDPDNYFTEYVASYDNPTDGPKAQIYVTRGINLTRTVCHEFLESMEKKANNVNASKKIINITAVLTTGILAMSRVGADAFTGVALATSLATSGADVFRDYYLLAPDADAIIELTKTSMKVMEKAIADAPPTSFDIAFANLQSYSKLCTSSEIRRLVRAALKTANPQMDYTGELSRTQDRIVKRNIAKEIGTWALTPDQFLGLFWVTTNGVQTTAHQTEIDNKLLGAGVKAALSGKEYKIGDLFRTLRNDTLKSYEKQVNQKIASLAAAEAKAAEAKATAEAETEAAKAAVAAKAAAAKTAVAANAVAKAVTAAANAAAKADGSSVVTTATTAVATRAATTAVATRAATTAVATRAATAAAKAAVAKAKAVKATAAAKAAFQPVKASSVNSGVLRVEIK